MKIVNDCFSKNTFNRIRDSVFDNNTPWHFIKTTYNGSQFENLTDQYSWVHSVLINEVPTSHLFNLIYPELINLLVKNKEPFNKISRIRLGLITKTEQHCINNPHIDSNSKHKVGLIYLNNSNAPTYIYQETYDPDSGLDILQYLNEKIYGKLDILTVSACEENKLVLFNGLHYHSSSTPTDVPRRVVINFNYT